MDRSWISRRWTQEEVRLLLETEEEEGQVLDYKEQLPDSRNEAAKRELCADVAAFANADGGVLVFGVAEKRDNSRTTGRPSSDNVGLADFDPDRDEARLRAILQSGIEPAGPALAIDVVDGYGHGPVVVVRVMRSWRGPMFVKHERETVRFYIRRGRDKLSMKWTEIQAAFLRGGQAGKLAQQFVDERVSRIIAGATPVLLPLGIPKALIHLIPMGQVLSGEPIALHQAVRSRELETRIHQSDDGYGTFPPRFNSDGLVKGDSHMEPGNTMWMYTQLFRDGCLEDVYAGGWVQDDGNINCQYLTRHLAEETTRYLRLLWSLEVAGPISVRITLTEVRGRKAIPFGRVLGLPHLLGRAIDRDVVTCPEILVEDLDAFGTGNLRDAFDAIWQACGYPYSPDFDQNGEWRLARTDTAPFDYIWELTRPGSRVEGL